MPKNRRTFSPGVSSRRSRQVREQTIGTHVVRGNAPRQRNGNTHRHNATYAEGVARKANGRRIIGIVAIVAVVLAIAIGAGVLVFRGIVGSELSLRDSDAKDALVAVAADEPRFVLASVELGAVAEPLETEGPDVFLLVRLDAEAKSLALINVPSSLQITYDNRSESLASIAARSDAEAIEAFSTFAKIDISHFVKMGADDVAGVINALGGIEIDVDQVIDDPQAGSVYLDEGNQVLDGEAALVYLRATNVALGSQDRMAHQLEMASRMIEKTFSRQGGFASRIESVSSFIQTDFTFDDLEALNSWLGGTSAEEIVCVNMPGYVTEATDVVGMGAGRFIGSAPDLAEMLADIEEGRDIISSDSDEVARVDSASFTVEVQNGTTIDGAASVTANALTNKGFKVTDVGNAEQAVYDETLVIYKGDEGLSRAKTVIDALGIGRAVSAGVYYSFESDVLLVIGSDYKPSS